MSKKNNKSKYFYEKHIVECVCTHQLQKNKKVFIPYVIEVFSLILVDDLSVVPKVVVCENCGRFHNVYEVGKSDMVDGGEYIDLSDVKKSIGYDDLLEVMDDLVCSFATYEEVEFCIKEKLYDRKICLSKNISDDNEDVYGKTLVLRKCTKKKCDFLVKNYSFKRRSGLQIV